MTETTNPQVFFDITIGGVPAGCIVMELRADVKSSGRWQYGAV
jgi:hypothetical protein